MNLKVDNSSPENKMEEKERLLKTCNFIISDFDGLFSGEITKMELLSKIPIIIRKAKELEKNIDMKKFFTDLQKYK